MLPISLSLEQWRYKGWPLGQTICWIPFREAFDWYTDLAPECIDSRDQMECEFLNRFYSTWWTISMMELTNTKQWKNESVIDYINPWHSLILDNKDRLSEVLTVEICIQGMHWGLIYILWGTWPRTLKELVTQAHDI